jgi:anti-anti-sigma factor
MAAEANERPQRSVPDTVTVTFSLHCAHVALRGEWDISTERRLADALARARERRHILIDLSDCSFLDSRAIGTLLALGIELAESNGHVAVALPRSQSTVVRAFGLLGVRKVLSVHDTLEDAQRSFPTTPAVTLSGWLEPSRPMPVD